MIDSWKDIKDFDALWSQKAEWKVKWNTPEYPKYRPLSKQKCKCCGSSHLLWQCSAHGRHGGCGKMRHFWVGCRSNGGRSGTVLDVEWNTATEKQLMLWISIPLVSIAYACNSRKTEN